jgi:competence protein ComEC
VEKWRDQIRKFLEGGATPPSSAILKALVLGEQGDIPEEISEQFTATGIAHLLAISGDHLGIVAFLSFSLLLWILKRSETLLLSVSVKKWAAALTIPCLLLYTLIAGAGISVIRATIMVIVFFLSILFQRERNLLHTLVLAAFLILLFSPPSLFDVSFQLSFLAVLSILYMVPRILPVFSREKILVPQETSWRQRLWTYVKLSFLVTGVATLGTAPFVALRFNRISPVGLLTNLFIIPWVGFLIVPMALVASVSSFFIPGVATGLIQVSSGVTSVLLQVVSWVASLPFTSLFLSTPTPVEIILFYLLLFLTVHLRRGKAMRILFICVSLALVFDWVYWSVKDRFQKDLVLTFIDVGHGDSILVEFPGGKRMLVDGGGQEDDPFDIGQHVIAPFLWSKKIRGIDYLVLTHPDPDHLNGLNFVASHFRVGQFWDNGIKTESEPYGRLHETLAAKKVERISFNQTSPPREIEGVQVFFCNPGNEGKFSDGERKVSFHNNHSLVMRLQFHQVAILLAGDIEKEAEYKIIRSRQSLQADILKVAHHGSSSSALFRSLKR